MKYKIAICDDDNNFIDKINSIIKDYYSTNKEIELSISTFDNAKKLLNDPSSYNIIFLDIEMPEISGLSVKKILEKENYSGSIVFVSNYEQYMSEAFGRNVVAYIPKNKLGRITETLKYIDENENRNKIIRIADTNIKIYEIYYIKSNYGYCTVYTKLDADMFSINLVDLYQRINRRDFMIVHRSYIVHLKYIKTFNTNEITLIDNTHIKLSRKYLNEFKERYFQYLKEC